MKKSLILATATLALSSTFAMAQNQDFIVNHLQQNVSTNVTYSHVVHKSDTENRTPLFTNQKTNFSYNYDNDNDNDNGRNSDQ